MAVTGVPGGPAVKAGVPVVELGTGMFAALGILAAYIAREKTGKGQYIDTSLLDCAVALGLIDDSDYLASGELPVPLASVHRRIAPHGALTATSLLLLILPRRRGRRSAAFWGKKSWNTIPGWPTTPCAGRTSPT